MKTPTSVRIHLALAALALVALVAPTAAWAQTGTLFNTVTPCRIFDSRTGAALSTGTQTVDVEGVCGIPTSATAVALLVTVVDPDESGYVILSEAGAAVPNTATVSFNADQTRTSNSIVLLSASGEIDVNAALGGGGSFDLVIDTTGYFGDSAPVLTPSGSIATFTEDGPPVAVDPGITVSNVSNPNLVSATVTITNPQDGAAEVLAATSCAGLTVTPGVNSLSITGNQPLAVYQTCLQSVTYANSDQDPGTTPRSLTYTADDGTFTGNATETVNVNGVNDAPVVTTTAGTTPFTENGGPVVVDAGVTVADVDSANLASATVTITNPQDGAAEVLAATSCAGLTVTPSLNTLSITGSQPLATYQTCLQSVTYDNTSQNPGTTTRVISFVANDGTASSTPATKMVSIGAVDNAPVVTTTTGPTSFTEDGGPVVVDAGVTVTDTDSANLASATVTITNPQDGAAEVLAATSCAGLTVTPGLNTVSITGSQPLATYQTCLQSVTYNNTSQNPGTTPRVISFVANDGTSSSVPATKTVTVAAVNDAPVVTTTVGATSFTEDGGPVVVDAGVTVADTDNANLTSATVTITNPQEGAAEVLAATSCAGLTVTPGLNTLSLTGSQPLATYQTCLQSVTFNDSSQNPNTTPRTISFVVNDGTAASLPATKTVNVAAVNDAPVVTTTLGPTGFTEDGGPVVVDAGVAVSDVDNANLASATVTLTNPQNGALEVLAATSCAGLTVTPGLNTLSITGSQPLATYQTCLQSVTYDNTSQNPGTTPRIISFVVNDGTTASAPATKTVNVTAVNDAPVVTTTVGTTAFTEDGGPVVVDSLVTVTDADSANLASATVTITNPQDGASEVLAATSCAGLTVTPGLNTLSITGSQPPATYQTCLRSVTYNNTSQNPNTTARTISFVANDGTAASAPATKTVSVAAVNDAPVVTTSAGASGFTEDGGPVVIDAAVTVSDVDNANLASATVTITNPQNGAAEVLSATTCPGLAVTPGLNTLSITGSQPLATYQTCLQSVTYDNSSQNPGTVARVISFVVNDGTTASAPATKMVNVTAVNDAPTVVTTGGATSFTEDGGPVVIDSGVTVADVDSANLASASVTISNPQDGAAEVLGATSCVGLTVTPGLHTLSITGSQPLATYQTCLRSVTYNNSSQNPNATTRMLSFVVNDGALSSLPAVKMVTVTPVPDAPVLTNNPITYTTPGNTQLHVVNTIPGVASWSDPQTALMKSLPTDPDGPVAPSVVPASGSSTNGGTYAIDAQGRFTYVPPVGFTGTDSFTYQVTDTVVSTTGTINITVGQRVWYIHKVTGADNPAGGDGRSTNAFDSIAAFNAATTNNGDIIYVFEADSATTPYTGTITLRDGQKLWGQGIALNVPGFGTPLATATSQSRIRTTTASTDVVSVPTTGGPRNNVEIRGLDLEATGATSNAIDVTSSGANIVGVTISNDNIRGATAEGIDLNAGSTGAFSATVQNNTITAAGNGVDTRTNGTGTATVTASSNMITSSGANAFDARTLVGAGALRVSLSDSNFNAGGNGVVIDGSAAGTTTITSFANNVVNPATGGSGITVTSATFDSDIVAANLQPVSGGTALIGASGDTVGGGGLLLTNVAGALDFTDLDVFTAGGGAGLAAISITGTGAFTGAAGTRVTVNAGGSNVGTVNATGGPGVSASAATIDLRLTSLTVGSSPSTGVNLVNVSDGSVAPAAAALIIGAGSIANVTGTDFNVDGGNATVSYPGSITNTAGRSVSVANRTGDSVTFTNTSTINDTGTGISLSSNAAGAVTDFLGTLTLSTGTNPAFAANNGGTLRVMGATNTITTTTGTALSVTGGTTIGAGGVAPETGLRFQTISAGTAASGPANGIVLNNTGTSGSLTVTGTGSAGSGGTIQRTTSDGVLLTSTTSPSFSWMSIKDTVGSGVKGSQVTNFSFTNNVVDNSGTGLGAETSNIAFNTTAVGTENNLNGTVTITGNTLTNAYYHGIDIFNFNGTIADANLSSNTITSTNSTATSKGTGIRFVAFGSATTVANVTKATIANNVISNFPSANGILASGGNGNSAGPAGTFGTAGSASNIIAITGNRVAGFSPAVKIGAFAIAATVNGKGQGNFNISGNGTAANPITNVIGAAITTSSLGFANVTASITNNVIVANNQAGAQGIGAGTSQTFAATDTPSLTVTISNNQVSQTDGNGILVTARDATGTVRAKIQNNVVAAPLSSNRNGIRVDAGNAVSINDSVCLNISGNTSAGVGLSPEGIGIRKQGTVAGTNSFAFHGFATSPANQSQTAAFVTAQNPGSASGTLIISGDNFNSPTCSFP